MVFNRITYLQLSTGDLVAAERVDRFIYQGFATHQDDTPCLIRTYAPRPQDQDEKAQWIGAMIPLTS